MAVRASMSDLILRVRKLINDPVAVSAAFTDQEIQDVLDKWRTEQRWVPLRPVASYTPGGAANFLDYYADTQYWESDIQLQDAGFNTITPGASEDVVGHWHFASTPNGTAVRATGKTYDVYGAAADLLDTMASQVMLDFSVMLGRDRYDRNQKFDMIQKLAQRYRGQAMPRSGRMVPGDDMPDIDGTGVTYPAYGGGYSN